MKRIFCILFVIGICFPSFADKKEDLAKDYKVVREQLQGRIKQVDEVTEAIDAYAKVVDEIDKTLKEFLSKGDQMQKAIESLETANMQISNELSETKKVITSPINCQMLIEYPLMLRYDSSLVSYSVQTIKAYKVYENEENKVLCKVMLPILQNYNKYYDSIYRIISMILNSYVVFEQPYSLDMFERDLNASLYYKDCYNQGYNIPYLDSQISLIMMLIKEKRLTKGNLKDILDEMN